MYRSELEFELNYGLQPMELDR